MKKKVLFIGLVWPEPEATAAGFRMLQLIDFFQFNNCEVTFCSSAKKSSLSYPLQSKGVKEVAIQLNDSSFDAFIKDLNPEFVVFDRFLTEEQYGWRVEDACPTAVKILDTEDLHFLRKSRKTNENTDFSKNELAKREIASIYRSDLTLIISKFELDFLKNQFNIPEHLLFYLPFLETTISENQFATYPSFTERKHFISIGNFFHEPNWQAVLDLKTKIWPSIRKELPQAELHVYGAYTTQKVTNLHNSKEGFIVKGWAENVETVFTHARVCLAPLSFGAGIKGKLLHSMKYGTPNVTTNIGAEGMKLDNNWNGFISLDFKEFAKNAVKLYKNEENWLEFQKNGRKLFNSEFDKQLYYTAFWNNLKSIQQQLEAHRSSNFIGSMLTFHTARSTKFLSKYVELKNKI